MADGASAVANALSSVYKVVKGIMENRWLSTLSQAGGWLLEGFIALFTGGGTQALMTALSAATDGIWDKIKGGDLKAMSSIATGAASAVISAPNCR